MSKKQTISAAILLMISFLFSDLLAGQYFPDDLDMPVRDKQASMSVSSKILKSMKEPPLWLLAKDREKISYRLIYREHWGYRHQVILRLDQSAMGTWVLIIKETNYFASDEDFKLNRKRRLSKEEIKKFQELFTQLQFWELPSVGALEHEAIWLDYPPIWVLEAVENERYHLVRRIVPNSTEWEADPRDAAVLQNFKEKEGYPSIDRATSEEVNKKLVAVGEYLVKLSSLELKLH